MSQHVNLPSRSSSPPRRQRACMPCTKAKARCQFRDEILSNRVCVRCERLGISCADKSTKSLRKPRQIRPLNNRVSTLEARLEELTAALEARSSPLLSESPNVSSKSPSSAILSTPSHETSPDGGGNGTSSKEPQPHSDTRLYTPPPFDLTWEQMGVILDIFRNNFVPQFPFIIVPAAVSARELYDTKPSLFRAIILVAAPFQISRLVKMKRQVLAYIVHRLLVEEERNIEVLQGLLVIIAWADLDIKYDHQVTNLTYMAIGYAHNLGITKIPPALLRQIGMDEGPEDVRRDKATQALEKFHSLEEQRAFLGCYCLLSINSTQFGRQNSLRSQYVDICCESLQSNLEYSSDYIIAQNVRMTYIGERISESFGAANDSERGRPFLFLLDDHVTSLRTNLDSIMESVSYEKLSTQLPQLSPKELSAIETAFSSRYHYLLVRLYEPATYLRNTTDEAGNPSHYRADCLQKCLLASVAFYDIVFSFPAEQFLYQSITDIALVTFVLLLSTRLLLIKDVPGWDITAARNTLDYDMVLMKAQDRLSAIERLRIEEVERFAKETGLNMTKGGTELQSTFMETAEKMGWITKWWASKSLAVENDPIAGNEGAAWWSRYDPNIPPNLETGPGSSWFGGLLDNPTWNFNNMEF